MNQGPFLADCRRCLLPLGALFAAAVIAACDDGGTSGSGGATPTTSSTGGSSAGGQGGAGGGTFTGGTGGDTGIRPDPTGACGAYCAQVTTCLGRASACAADCNIEAVYDSQLGDTCALAFQSVLECVTALTCDEVTLDARSGGAQGSCAEAHAAYAGLAECAPPVVCDGACAVLQGCDPLLGSATCRFGCAIDIRNGQSTVSGECGDLQMDYFQCVSGATCETLADGSACVAEKAAIENCL